MGDAPFLIFELMADSFDSWPEKANVSQQGVGHRGRLKHTKSFVAIQASKAQVYFVENLHSVSGT